MPYLINQSVEGLPSISASYDYIIRPEPPYSGDTLLRDTEALGISYSFGRHLTWAFERLDPSLMPKKLIFRHVLEKQRDFEYLNSVGRVWLLSKKFKDIIEVLEPDVHQFIPVETVGEDGRQTPVEYFFLIVQQRAFTVDVYSSPQIGVEPPYGPKNMIPTSIGMPPKDGSPGLVHFSERVGARHLWCELNRLGFTDPNPSKIFFDLIPSLTVSDALMSAMREHNILGTRIVATGIVDSNVSEAMKND